MKRPGFFICSWSISRSALDRRTRTASMWCIRNWNTRWCGHPVTKDGRSGSDTRTDTGTGISCSARSIVRSNTATNTSVNRNYRNCFGILTSGQQILQSLQIFSNSVTRLSFFCICLSFPSTSSRGWASNPPATSSCPSISRCISLSCFNNSWLS